MAYNAFYPKDLNDKVIEVDYTPITPVSVFELPSIDDSFFWAGCDCCPVIGTTDAVSSLKLQDSDMNNYVITAQPFLGGRPPHPPHPNK